MTRIDELRVVAARGMRLSDDWHGGRAMSDADVAAAKRALTDAFNALPALLAVAEAAALVSRLLDAQDGAQPEDAVHIYDSLEEARPALRQALARLESSR